jgi:hypothetical protein
MAGSDERKAALEDLMQRCWTQAGIRISGQDLRRVAGYKQPNRLYKCLNRGRLGKRFQKLSIYVHMSVPQELSISGG